MIVYYKEGGLQRKARRITLRSAGEPAAYVNIYTLQKMSRNPIFTNCLQFDLDETSVVDALTERVDAEKGIWRSRVTIHNPGDIVNNAPQVEDIEYGSYMVYAEPDQILLTADEDSKELNYAGLDEITLDRSFINMQTMQEVEGDLQIGRALCKVDILSVPKTGSRTFAGVARFVELNFLFHQQDLRKWKQYVPEIVEMLTGVVPDKKNV